MLSQKLEILQRGMLLRLEEIRESHKHRGNIGTNVEAIVREFLKEFLPPSNRIGQGEVIDLSGAISTQLDVIITNEYHPFLNNLTAPSVFFIEGVAFAGEVKSVLTSQDLPTILTACTQFKTLTPQIPKGTIAHGNQEDLGRFFFHKRPYFLFAFESQLSLDKIKSKIESYNARSAPAVTDQIDAVFLLDKGVIINCGAGNGVLRYRLPNGETIPGVHGIPIAHNPGVLLQFLGWISATLPFAQMPYLPTVSYLIPTLPEPDATAP